jgi:hypothetical protein
MATRYVITRHAIRRFAERYERIAELKADLYRLFLLGELERAVLFRVQPHYDQFLSLACGGVAAVVLHNGTGYVKTVLTRQQALQLHTFWKRVTQAA